MRLTPLMGPGIGLAINNSRAVLQAMTKEVGAFERTPKYRIESRNDQWRTKRYRVKANVGTLLEGVLTVWFIIAFLLAIQWGMWSSLPFLYLFLQGYCYMYGLSLVSGGFLGRHRSAARPATAPISMDSGSP